MGDQHTDAQALTEIEARDPRYPDAYTRLAFWREAWRPHFGLDELRELRKALSGALMYVGPVAISEHATAAWRDAKHWLDRVDSLIAEFAEYDETAPVASSGAPAHCGSCARPLPHNEKALCPGFPPAAPTR